MPCNIAHTLAEVAQRQADERALTVPARGGDRHWSFGQLHANTCRHGAALHRLGVRPGQRVMCMVRPSMEFVCLTFALFRLGAVVILIDPGMGYRNLLRCIASVRPEALVGIHKAILFSRLFPASFQSLGARIRVGPGLLGVSLDRAAGRTRPQDCPLVDSAAEDLAAIIFTTGSTGPPKGVQYSHGIFHAQLELIRDTYCIGPGEVDQPAFPLFALFSTALGARAVIPDMDPTRPAQVDPVRFIRSIVEHGVTYSFGSPAIWNVVSRHCIDRGIVLPLRKVLMAGAPVPGELVERVQRIMPPDAEIHTPYGATESLPICSLSGAEIVTKTWPQTRKGAGACVGRPLPGIDIRVIRPVDGPITKWSEAEELQPGVIGEIVVQGPVVTRAYDGNEKETRLAKIEENDEHGRGGSGGNDKKFWHRMGDMGCFDAQGRLWFQGRKAHRVLAAQGPLYTIACEAIFNEHPAVFRSALVGLGEPGRQRPVLIVELFPHAKAARLLSDLRELALANPLTEQIDTFLVHPAFPVDIRHNAKIFREKLALWAARRLQSA